MFYTNEAPTPFAQSVYYKRTQAISEREEDSESITVSVSTSATVTSTNVTSNGRANCDFNGYNSICQPRERVNRLSPVFGSIRPLCAPEQLTSAFPAVRQPPKKDSNHGGITVVNVYNNGKEKSSRKRRPKQRVAEREVVLPRTDKTQDSESSSRRVKRSKCKKQQTDRAKCLATNEERAVALGEKGILPRWHELQDRNRHSYKDSQYDGANAKKEWAAFYGGVDESSEHKTKPEKKERSAWQPARSTKQQDDTVHVEFADDASSKIQHRLHKTQPHECRPFYGAMESQRFSLQAIGHLVKARKELARLQFATGHILPHTKDYIDCIDWIHDDLKKYNTQFRELQQQTDDVLQQKMGNHTSFYMTSPPRGSTPYPSAGFILP